MKLGRILATIFLCFLPWAATADVQIDAQVGLDPQTPLVRSNAWAPLIVTVRNTGPDVEGTLRINVRDRNGRDPWTREYPLAIARNATKQVRSAVFLRAGAESIEIVFGNRHGPQGSASVPFQFAESMSTTVAIVGDEDWVHSVRTQTREDPRPLRAVLYAVRRETMPEDAFGYDGIDTVVLDRLDWTQVSRSQAGALRAFVEAGGNLVVSAGRSASGLSRSPVAGLLPVIVGETELATHLLQPIPNVAFIRADRRLLVSGASPRPNSGLTILGEDKAGQPLVAEAPLGLGRVTWLGFQLSDPALRDWIGRFYLWRFLFARRAEPVLDTNTGEFADRMCSVLQKNTVMALPSSSQIGWLFVAYVVGFIPLNHLFWRRMKRPFWAWWSLAAVSVGMSAALIVNERIVTGDTFSLTEIDLLQSKSGCQTAMADSCFSLQSPVSTRLQVTASHSQLEWRPIFPDDDSRREDHHFMMPGDPVPPRLQFDVARKGLAFFLATHRAPIDRGIDVKAEAAGKRVSGQVQNLTAMEFVDSGLLAPEANVRLGPLGLNQVIAVDAPSTNAVSGPPLAESSAHLREFVQQSVLPRIDARHRVVFWGLARGAVLDPQFAGEGDRSPSVRTGARWTILLCEAPFLPGEGPFSVTPGHWRIRTTRISAYSEDEYVGRDMQHLPSPLWFDTVEFEATPDMALTVDPRQTIDEFVFHPEVVATSSDVRFELFNFHANDWEPLSGVVFRRFEAVKYLHPRTGAVLIRLTGKGEKEIHSMELTVTGRRDKPEPHQ